MGSENKPFFSVVIPLYNKQSHIKETIETVIAQTFQDFELIVINDGSKDDSAEVVESIKDSRIKLINQENAGVSVARNRGIKEAKAEYIAFLDGDDLWKENHLEVIYRLICKFPDAGMFSTAYELKQNNKIQSLHFEGLVEKDFDGIIPDYFKTLAFGDNPTWSSVVVIKKEGFNKVGGFPKGVRMGEDLDTWIRIGINYQVCFSSTVTAQYNLEADNRACSKYTQSDLDSIMFTKWFEYIEQNDSAYLKLFIKKTQLNYIYNMTIYGLGKDIRKNILTKMFRNYSWVDIFPYYLLSFLSKNIIDKIRDIKRKIRGHII